MGNYLYTPTISTCIPLQFLIVSCHYTYLPQYYIIRFVVSDMFPLDLPLTDTYMLSNTHAMLNVFMNIVLTF
jgi:hypothetical protein